jgi:hypothetical protein
MVGSDTFFKYGSGSALLKYIKINAVPLMFGLELWVLSTGVLAMPRTAPPRKK